MNKQAIQQKILQ